jgi:hypothetical protein
MTIESPSSGTEVKGAQNLFQRHRNLFTALLLAIAAWLFYLPSTRYNFIYYDDVRILQDHPELYGQPHFSADLKAIFVTGFPREEPLLVRDVTWAIDSKIWGFGNAFGYHLGNVVLHGFVAALLFAFLMGTTRRYGLSLAATCCWLILAVHTESVAWIMGRKDILSALFMLAALCAQTRRLGARNFAGQGGWYLFTLALFTAGVFSKINVLTFPLVLLLHGVFLPYLCGERQSDASFQWNRALAREILLSIPAFAISGLVFLWYHRTLAQMGIFDRGYQYHGWGHIWNLLMIDPMALWVYLRQFFFPNNLSVLYTWPALETGGYPLWQVIAAIATLIAVCGIGIWMFWKRKDLFFYYCAFFASMLTYLNLQYIGIWVADRYIYFSSVCIVVIAVLLAKDVLRQGRPAMRICLAAFGAFFVIINLFQGFLYLQAWRNAESLWQYHIALPHPSPTAYENLAAYYYTEAVARQNTPEMALPMSKMDTVVDAGLKEFWPDRQQQPPVITWYLFFLQSIVQEVKGDQQGALESLLTADRLHPRFDSVNLNLAQLYRKLAETTHDAHQQQTFAHDALTRYEEYIDLEFRGRPVSPDIQKEVESLKSEYPYLSGPTNNAK